MFVIRFLIAVACIGLVTFGLTIGVSHEFMELPRQSDTSFHKASTYLLVKPTNMDTIYVNGNLYVLDSVNFIFTHVAKVGKVTYIK